MRIYKFKFPNEGKTERMTVKATTDKEAMATLQRRLIERPKPLRPAFNDITYKRVK